MPFVISDLYKSWNEDITRTRHLCIVHVATFSEIISDIHPLQVPQTACQDISTT
jgi:hypothetical protein